MISLKCDNRVEYLARSVRIGTLKTSASFNSRAENEKGSDGMIKVTIDMKGIRFTVKPDGGDKHNGDINIKIPCRRLRKISFHPGRPCPTLWVVTDEKFAEKIRFSLNMKPDGPYYDPKSTELAEQEISFISGVDSIPYTVVHSMYKIFDKMSNDLDLDGNLFQEITNAQNNEKLMQSAKMLSRLDNVKMNANSNATIKNVGAFKTSTKRTVAMRSSGSGTDEEIEIKETSKIDSRSKKAKTNDVKHVEKNEKDADALKRDRCYCKELLKKLTSFTPEKNARSKALITQLISQIEYDQVIHIR